MRKFAMLMVVGVSAPVWAGSEMRAVTPSGRTEMMFREATAQDASGKLASRCMGNGLTVVSSEPRDVTCELKMNMLKSALAQALIGNSYSTPPRTFIRFIIVQVGSDVRVQANEWMETQMAFGQIRRQELNSDDVHNDLMNFLETAGAAFIPGTSFPNHAYLGMEVGSSVTVSYKGKQTSGLTLSNVTPDAALAKAGVQAGDTLVAIEDKTFKTFQDFVKRLKGIPINSSMKVAILRNGQPLTLTAVAGRRPSISAEDMTKVALTPVALSPIVRPASVQAFSVADELSKLVALKDKGVLTEAEFQAQKAVLLNPR